MSRKPEAGLHQYRLVDRRGDHRACLALQRHLDGERDGFDGGGGVRRIGFAGRARRMCFGPDDRVRRNLAATSEHIRIADEKQGPLTDAAAERGEGGGRHFRPDAGRFAHGDEKRSLLGFSGLRCRHRASSRGCSDLKRNADIEVR